ncbi:hypothetical protein FA13DRAFT_671153 [Coprinellus micaceus]|uniref:Uncharacterized protein n=1 Tax=Coprinellus micaceus TaxID=71717 RepID=A0A4Y7T531_COPMI|nr:hypothetical protein FA13DRAFT_671153 [Coprinellus micaceus]
MVAPTPISQGANMGPLFEQHALEANSTSPHFSWTKELTLVSKIVKVLLERGVDPNSEGGSALYAVCIDGSLDIARLLLETGADPNLQGVLSGAALYAACAGKHSAIAQLLLEHRADPNIQGQGFQGFSRGLTVLQRVQGLMVEKTWDMNELDAIAALLRQYGAE